MTKRIAGLAAIALCLSVAARAQTAAALPQDLKPFLPTNWEQLSVLQIVDSIKPKIQEWQAAQAKVAARETRLQNALSSLGEKAKGLVDKLGVDDTLVVSVKTDGLVITTQRYTETYQVGDTYIENHDPTDNTVHVHHAWVETAKGFIPKKVLEAENFFPDAKSSKLIDAKTLKMVQPGEDPSVAQVGLPEIQAALKAASSELERIRLQKLVGSQPN
jgi:hypothetical protein